MNSSRLLVRDGGIDHNIPADGMSRTVPGQAVVPSTRVNKSRCDRKCRFPSVGGLHRSSHDSSVSTASTTFPIWCHVDKSKSPSSTRTHVAAFAYISKRNHPKRSTSHRRQLNQSRKFSKQRIILKDVKVPTIAFSNVKRLNSIFIKILLSYVMEGQLSLQSTKSIILPTFAYCPYPWEICGFMIR